MDGPTSPAVEGGASAGDIQQPVKQDADLVYQGEQEVEKYLESALQRLPLRNPMSIASLLNPVDEEPTVHAELSDAENSSSSRMLRRRRKEKLRRRW
uniref:Uncharacterized protein n=1 Tax=Peronospora matthiolae TaxID=2874970 RepID=A0AAV1THS1_9STRA